MQSKRVLIGFWLTLASVLLLGCASPKNNQMLAAEEASAIIANSEIDDRTKSSLLLESQIKAAERQLADGSAGRIIFAGFAMHSESKAFRSDVALAEEVIRAIDPNAIVFTLDNPAYGQSVTWPFATSQNMAVVMDRIGMMARPEDKVVLLLSTHGNEDILAINLYRRNHPSLDSKWLRFALAGLRGKPTLMLISACYSGSFITPLAAPSRIILTAAAADRNSFGCQFKSTNTYFVDALLNQPAITDQSLTELMAQAKIEVAQRERTQKLSPPSMPQIFIGSHVQDWADQPLKDWLKP